MFEAVLPPLNEAGSSQESKLTTGEVSAYLSGTETENCVLLFPGTHVVSVPVLSVQLPQQKYHNETQRGGGRAPTALSSNLLLGRGTQKSFDSHQKGKLAAGCDSSACWQRCLGVPCCPVPWDAVRVRAVSSVWLQSIALAVVTADPLLGKLLQLQ